MTQDSTIWLITSIVLFIGAVLINLFNNLKDAKNGHINHSKAWKIKALSCIPCILSLSSISNFKWLIALTVSAFVVACFFYFFFDMAWSLKVYGEPFHKSTATGKNKANSDKLVSNWPVPIIIAFKLLLILLSLWLFNIGLAK